MTQEQILSIVRQLLLTGGGGLVSAGYVTASNWQLIVGGLVALVGSAWAFYAKRQNGLIASAAAVPAVGKIVTTPAIAAAVPSSKVVS